MSPHERNVSTNNLGDYGGNGTIETVNTLEALLYCESFLVKSSSKLISTINHKHKTNANNNIKSRTINIFKNIQCTCSNIKIIIIIYI